MQELAEYLQELQDKGLIQPSHSPWEDHDVHLKLVLELLKKEKLFAKFSKCKFLLQEVHFLGYVINSNGIHVDRSKIEAMKNWKAPKSSSEIRSFLGLAGYYRRFIMNFSKIAKPLTSLTQKNQKYEWGMKQEESGVKDKILAAQGEASKVKNALVEMLCDLDQQVKKKEDGGLYFMDRIYVPLIGGVRTVIMDEAHTIWYYIHLGADKMYHDLRDMYWWPGIKKDIATYVSKCLTYSKVNAEHQRPSGLLHQPEIPEWKWERIIVDSITKLPRYSSGYDTIWVIVDRLTKSAHFLAIREDYKMQKLAMLYIDEIVVRHGVPVLIISDHDRQFTSQFWQTLQKEMVQETTDKVVQIKGRLKAARDRQKSYADNRRPSDIIERIGPIAYLLRLPHELSSVHDTFHVSNWKKCLADANMHVPLEELKVDKM
ncbi:putative reverse transcriptase domain-containing protein [Tanacetum coccineum]